LPLLDNSNNDEQSPYEEVAANISNKDDPTMLCLTFRSVSIGILLTCLTSFTSQFFAYRTSPLSINTGIIILLSYILGQLCARILPEKIFNIPLNPGPFSVKEHTLSTLMATSGITTATALEAITVQRIYYNYYLGHFYTILFLIMIQLLSLSIAGILKRYLVWPASMIWPETLLSCGLIRTLTMEDGLKETGSKWKMTRSTFFWLILLVQFVYYWLPGYIFPLLSFFSFVCIIAPHKTIFSQITGANGLGLGAIELDWSAWVGYLGSPVLVPFW
jgi:OPT family oligopeptide transporter